MERQNAIPQPRARRGSLLKQSVALLVALAMAASFLGVPTAFAVEGAAANAGSIADTGNTANAGNTAGAGAVAGAGDGSQEPIVIVHTNDVHCAVDDNLGYAKLASYADSLEEQYGEDRVTLVDAGDAVQGNVIGTLSQGEYLVDLMNAVDYDIAVPGNHEFDYGMAQFNTLVALSNAKYLSCNLTDLRTGETVLDPYTIVDYGTGEDAIQVAYVGISTPETLTKSSPNTFKDESGAYVYGFCQDETGDALYGAVQSAVDAARAEGADYVVAVSHLGQEGITHQWRSDAVVEHTTGIDALIDGHSHEAYVQDDVRNAAGAAVPVVQTGYGLQNIGTVTIEPDTGEVSAQLVSEWDGTDADVAAAVQDVRDELAETTEQVIGSSEHKLVAIEDDGFAWAVRHRETNLGDFVADAYLYAARSLGYDADLAFVNGGGLRADVAQGDVTYGDLINVNPYSNQLVHLEATGQQILDALELGARNLPESAGGFLQVAGVTYTIRADIPSSVRLDDEGRFAGVAGEYRVRDVTVGGEPLDLERTYGLVSISYLVEEGGDGMTMFTDDATLIGLDSEALIEYIQDGLGGVIGEQYAEEGGQGRVRIVDHGPSADDPCARFTDVDRSAWYHDAIDWALENGALHGIGGTDLMMPDADLSRAQMATILHNLEGNPAADPTGAAAFADCDAGAWYAEAVAWARGAGVLTGYDNGLFGPNDALTREQAAAVIMRWAAGQGEDVSARADLAAFPDAGEVSPWADDAMSWAVAAGVLEGVEQPDGQCVLNAQDAVTRAEMAALLMRLM